MQVREGDSYAWKQTSHSLHIAFPQASEKGFSAKRVLLVGASGLSLRALHEASEDSQPPYIVGIVDSGTRAIATSRHPDIPVLGGIDDLEAVVAEKCVDEIRLVLPDRRLAEMLPHIETTASSLGVAVTSYYPSQSSQNSGLVTKRGHFVTYLGRHSSQSGWRAAVKRSVDVLISGIALVLLAPLFALIAVAIKLTSPGPVLFHQQRIGTRRRQFRMLKFRTMLKNAEELRARVREQNNARGISFKVFDDPRLTPIGSVLRRTSLDELPQLVNVFLGDMTLIGPRPIPVFVAELMQGTAYLRRFCVKQGLTGLWQVEGRQQDFDYMAIQDLRYVDKWSLALDLKILLRTLPAVIRGDGAH